MGLLFDRTIAVSFGRPGELGQLFRGIYIQFDITMSTEPKPNPGEIKIYNLNETTRALLQQEKKDLVVQLQAGYQGVLEELYFGDIANIFIERTGPDIITTIRAGSGERTLTTATINETLAKGASTKNVVETLARGLNVGIGAIKGVVEDTFQHGVTLSGSISDRLNDITEKMGLEWNIQNNALNILPPNVPSEKLAIVLNKFTGLIGRPIEREQDVKNPGKTIEFKSLFRTRLKPGVAVAIESENVNGFFKIRKSKFQGDNKKGPFGVTCEASEIDPTINVPNQQLNI